MTPAIHMFPVRDIASIHYGKALRQGERTKGGSVPVFGSNGQIDFHDLAVVSEPTLIVGRKGSVGQVTFAPNGGWPIDTVFYTRLLNPDHVDLRYLYYALKRARLDRWTITTSIPGLNRGDLYAAEVPLPTKPDGTPDIDEQRRIAAILDKADAIRRKRQEAIKLTEQLLRSAFLEMFGDPVTNPKGWPLAEFGNVGTLDRGRSRHRPRNDPALLGGSHPLIQTGEVSNCDGEIREYTSTYSQFGLEQSRMWPPRTLCITIAANIAKTGILTFEACFPDSVVGFHPGEDATTEFIQGWLSFLQPTLEAQAPQSAQKNINLRILRALKLPLPPIQLQREYSNFVQHYRRHRVSMRTHHDKLLSLQASLTQRAFRGDL